MIAGRGEAKNLVILAMALLRQARVQRRTLHTECLFRGYSVAFTKPD